MEEKEFHPSLFYLNTSDHADCRFRTCDLRVTGALLYQQTKSADTVILTLSPKSQVLYEEWKKNWTNQALFFSYNDL